MAKKKENQMAAQYADILERNKQFEQHNAEYAAELATLRANVSASGSASITRDELKQILSEILLSENESLKITNELVKVTDKNVRSTYNYFLKIAQGEYFQEFCKYMGIFRDSAVKYVKDLSGATQKLAETTKFHIDPAIGEALSATCDKAVDGVVERFEKALMEASDRVLKKVREDKACITLSGTATVLFSNTLISSLFFLFVTLLYNYLFWHCETLFTIQYWFLAIILVPMLVVLAYKLWKHRRRD